MSERDCMTNLMLHAWNMYTAKYKRPGLILGFLLANERRCYKAKSYHWLGANLESALRDFQISTSVDQLHTTFKFLEF